MRINLLDVFSGRTDAWKDAIGLMDDLINGTDDRNEIRVLTEVRERVKHEYDMARHTWDSYRDRAAYDPLIKRHRKDYGTCVGCREALDFVSALPESITRDRVIARMKYEFDKDIPVKPTFRKGVYGKKYDSYSCGNCGYGGVEIHERHCPNCGFAIAWKERYDIGQVEEMDEERGLDNTSGEGIPQEEETEGNRELPEDSREGIDDTETSDRDIDGQEGSEGADTGEDYIQRSIFDCD